MGRHGENFDSCEEVRHLGETRFDPSRRDKCCCSHEDALVFVRGDWCDYRAGWGPGGVNEIFNVVVNGKRLPGRCSVWETTCYVL